MELDRHEDTPQIGAPPFMRGAMQKMRPDPCAIALNIFAFLNILNLAHAPSDTAINWVSIAVLLFRMRNKASTVLTYKLLIC
jgi:hypothetical protein